MLPVVQFLCASFKTSDGATKTAYTKTSCSWSTTLATLIPSNAWPSCLAFNCVLGQVSHGYCLSLSDSVSRASPKTKTVIRSYQKCGIYLIHNWFKVRYSWLKELIKEVFVGMRKRKYQLWFSVTLIQNEFRRLAVKFSFQVVQRCSWVIGNWKMLCLINRNQH